jgi:hypothetical protein
MSRVGSPGGPVGAGHVSAGRVRQVSVATSLGCKKLSVWLSLLSVFSSGSARRKITTTVRHHCLPSPIRLSFLWTTAPCRRWIFWCGIGYLCEQLCVCVNSCFPGPRRCFGHCADRRRRYLCTILDLYDQYDQYMISWQNLSIAVRRWGTNWPKIEQRII